MIAIEEAESGWALLQGPKDFMGDTAENYIPMDDLRPHEWGENCWCHPEVMILQDGERVIHNSMDGREKYEEGELLKH